MTLMLWLFSKKKKEEECLFCRKRSKDLVAPADMITCVLKQLGLYVNTETGMNSHYNAHYKIVLSLI